MNREEYYKQQLFKVIDYWFDKEKPNMGRFEMKMTCERHAENYPSKEDECNHEFIRTTRNYIHVYRCALCNLIKPARKK